MLSISLAVLTAAAAVVARPSDEASPSSPLPPPAYATNSNIPTGGISCDVQLRDAIYYELQPFSAADVYDAITKQPGVMGFKGPTGKKTVNGHDGWTMEWRPQNTNYKTITLNWATDSAKYIYWTGASTSIVSCLIGKEEHVADCARLNL